MDFKKKRLTKALEENIYKVKLVHSKKGWLTVGLTFVTLFSAGIISQKTVDASAINNVAVANSAKNNFVQLYNSVTNSSIHKANRGLANGTAWKTAKAVKGVDGETYVLVGGNEYANVSQMDLRDETSKQSLTGIVHVADGNGSYATLYSDPLSGAKRIGNRALAKNSNWKTDQKVVVNGAVYYRVATNEWVKGTEATISSENTRSAKTYISNGPDAVTTDDQTTNNSTVNTNHNNDNNSTNTPVKNQMVTIKINYFHRSTTTNDHYNLKTETRTVKLGSVITINAPKIPGYTVVPGEGSSSNRVQFDGEEFNIPYTKDATSPVKTPAKVTIKAVDENNQAIDGVKDIVVPDQEVGQTYTATAPGAPGYTLNDDENKTITVAKDNNVITFKFKKNEQIPVVKTSKVTVNYLTADGSEVAPAKTITDQKVGETVSEYAPTFDGYELKSSKEAAVKVAEDGSATITFMYEKSETAPVVDKADVTVKYQSKDGSELAKSKTISAQEVGSTVEESAVTIDGYTADAPSKNLTVSKQNNVITFTYTKDEVIDPVTEKANVIIKFVDDNGKEIADSKTLLDQVVGSTISQSAIKADGYTIKGDSEKSLTVSKDEKDNVITFTYSEDKLDDKVDVSKVSDEIIESLNTYRKANGLGALHIDKNLATGSLARVDTEAEKVNASGNINDANHDEFEAQTQKDLNQYNGFTMGENLAISNGSTTDEVAQNAMDQWKNSALHNANMLNKSFTDIGVGVKALNNGQFVLIQDFGGSVSSSESNETPDNTTMINNLGFTSEDVLYAAKTTGPNTTPGNRDIPIPTLANDPRTYFGDRVFKTLSDFKKWTETKHNSNSIWDEGLGCGCFLGYAENGRAIGYIPYVYGLSDTPENLLNQGKTKWTTDYVIPVGQPITLTINYELYNDGRTSHTPNFFKSKIIEGKSGDTITLEAPSKDGYRLDEAHSTEGSNVPFTFDIGEGENQDYTFWYISNNAPLQPEGDFF